MATSTPTNIGNLVSFQDSAPVMTSASNINIQNSGDVAHTGAFAFNLGADGANASNDVITNLTGSATVGGVAVTNWVLTPGAEINNGELFVQLRLSGWWRQYRA